MANTLLHLGTNLNFDTLKGHYAYIDLETIKNFDDVVNHPAHKNNVEVIEKIRWINMHQPGAEYRSSMSGFIFDKRLQKYQICFVENYDDNLIDLEKSYQKRKSYLLTSKIK